MLSFINLGCRRDKLQLFSDVNHTVYRSQKVGVTGANGSGKSSLFAMICGDIEPDEGEISLQNGVVVAHVKQETIASEQSAIDFVLDGDQRLRQLERALELSDAEHNGEKHASLLAEYENSGAYTANARAGALLFGLGFNAAEHAQPVSSFSGGWRMRLNLAQALMCPSDLLLLDEPTNHLDLDAVLWLESWLQQYAGSLLLISHDREFLDRTVGHILNLEQGSIRSYTGNYSEFEHARAERLAGQQSAYLRQQKKVAEIQGFVDRFRAKATKAKQAQSRLKMLERMTLIAPAHVDSHFSFSFHKPQNLPNPLVTLEEAALGYPDHTVYDSVTVSLQAGDRLGLLGMNGAGKSTLLKTLVGDLEPLSGTRVAGANLSIGYFAQHQIDQLVYDQSPLDHFLSSDSTLGEAQARNILGGFGFRGDQVLQSVGTLSGGEKARLALGLMVHQRPNMLLLDEPTNHLDIDMRHALCEALQGFEGALVVISHDRFLLKTVVDQFWLVANRRVVEFQEDLDGYARWLTDQRRDVEDRDASSTQQSVESSEHRASVKKEKKREAAELRRQLQPLQKAAQKFEKELDKLRESIEVVRIKLTDSALYSTDKKELLAEIVREEASLKQRMADVEDQWLAALEALEEAERKG